MFDPYCSNMPDAVKETIVGLGAMTNSILAKSSQDFDEDFDLKQVHQDDDYSKNFNTHVTWEINHRLALTYSDTFLLISNSLSSPCGF